MKNVNEPVKEYLRLEFQKLFNNSNIIEWIGSHVERGSVPATYSILEEWKKFIVE